MNNKIPIIAAIFALAATLIGAFFYQHEKQTIGELRARVVAGELQPIARLLQEDQANLKELQAEPFAERDSGILESYLAKIRRDGVPKTAEMKQKLDQLAENNTAIVTLIKAYASHARTPGFTAEGDNFRNYASAWRDRWNSVMELFIAGGNYAVSGVPFPAGFPAAVEAEMKTAKGEIGQQIAERHLDAAGQQTLATVGLLQLLAKPQFTSSVTHLKCG
jgi:hypothetical protein